MIAEFSRIGKELGKQAKYLKTCSLQSCVMVISVKSLFARQKSKIYALEIKDEKINEDIARIIKKLKESVNDVQKAVQNKNLYAKQEFIQEMQDLSKKLLEKSKKVLEDVQTIKNIEQKVQEYVEINDSTFLNNKEEQLKQLNTHIQHFIDLLVSNPSIRTLEEEALETLNQELEELSNAIQKILDDDQNLKRIYEKLLEL